MQLKPRLALALALALAAPALSTGCRGPERQDPPPAAAYELMRIGEQYLAQGRALDAVEQMRKAETVAPNSFTVKMALGRAQFAASYLDAAIATYNKAAELDPKSPEPWNEEGRIYLTKGLYPEAEEYFDKAIKKDDRYVNAYFNKGVLYYDYMKRAEEARKMFEKALSLRSDLPDAQVNLGRIDADNGYWDNARAHFEAALQLKPDHALALANLGYTYLAQKRYERAIDVLKRATGREPRAGWAWLQLGYAYRAIGRRESARECFKKVLALDPQNQEAKDQLRDIEQERPPESPTGK
ncbi:MAG TPA: tetratricopeptide repeat protein [Planctomycetota bacterium]|nr:tetratricopeptide repeat protein [Planctomycetota bacterium]